MLNFLKTTFTDLETEDIANRKFVKESQAWHGGRATAFVQNYQIERLWKQNYILVNVIAEGYDQKRFLEAMIKVKKAQPNVDYFSRGELKELVKQFKDDQREDTFESSRRDSFLNTSTAQLFDDAMNRRRSSSILRRRATMTAEETVLNHNMGTSCVVSSINQYITSSVGGFVRDQSQMITIDTFPMKWRVKRLDTDFEVLREYLLRAFPQTIIAPLPKIKKTRLSKRQASKRQTYYQRFLNALLKSHVLRTSKFLVAFLSEGNQEQFNVKLLTIEEETGPKNIYEFKTLTGEIEVEQRKRAAKFCNSLTQFTKQYEKINSFLSDKCKDLQLKSHDLADEYYAIGAQINHFSEVLKVTEIPQIVNIYRRLSDLIIRNGDFTLQSGELVNSQLSGWFKYQRQEANSFKEAQWLRDESLERYNARRQDLVRHKERLFKKKDISEWGVAPDKMRQAMESMNDAETAFTFMLPNATKQVNYLAEESAYFTTQAFKEARRVTMADYTMAREHFVDMGEQMHRHIYEINLGWGQFLDFYSDLNNARKEQDDQYVEKNYIGEEVIEPDEQPQYANDLYDAYDGYGEDKKENAEGVEENEEGQLLLDADDNGQENMLADLQRELQEEEEKKEAENSRATNEITEESSTTNQEAAATQEEGGAAVAGDKEHHAKDEADEPKIEADEPKIEEEN